MKTSEGKIEACNVITNKNPQSKEYVCRWDWNKPWNDIKTLGLKRYKEGTEEFKQLDKCNKILIVQKR